MDTSFSQDELDRYSRHLVIPEVGIDGQQKLKRASVLVVGAGGLGAPVIQYLAAAGIGKLGVVDFDKIDSSNLQRQVLFSTADVGQLKVDVACERASSLNPEIAIYRHRAKLSSENVAQLFQDYSIIVDGSDNFETRYLVNDACVLLGKTNVHGAVHRFDGQISVFSPGNGPCYRCVFSEPPEPGAVLNCAEAGVLGVLPGIVGTIQATECIKNILSIGVPLIGKLLLVDALDMSFRTINLKRNPKCTTCGDTPEIKSMQDLIVKHVPVDRSCALNQGLQNSAGKQLAATELAEELANSNKLLLIDVREANEYNYSHLQNAIHFPLSNLPQSLHEIPKDANVVVYCKSGARSLKAAEMLQQAGVRSVRNLNGGLSAWSRQVDTSLSVL
ncbi:MAG: molybdopterin-synthase adenylyltransferase MoeB [Cyanobacteria bacterium SZAS-4]|nr:molybdopterin-synthase adenylyltransferase MoeB [Cyanobacteria bacterium SZAS-4]